MCIGNNLFAPIHVSSIQFEGKKLEPAPTSAENDYTQPPFLKQWPGLILLQKISE